MSLVVAEQELYNACYALFGPNLTVNRDFLEYLQPTGVRTAFRKRAFETHPDRDNAKNGKSFKQDTDNFLIVQQAYENLSNYLVARERGFRFPPTSLKETDYNGYKNSNFKKTSKQPSQTAYRHRNNSNNFGWDAEKLYSGPVPSRRLLLGHYLYYSGIINWRTIIKALVWQRTKRPRLGEIGRDFGWLSETDIPTILKKRKPFKKFGESAVDLGLLTKTQLKMIIIQQRRLQKKIGGYFTENGILTHTQLQAYVNKCCKHNKKLAESSSRNGFNH